MECFAPYSSCIKVLFNNTQPRSVNKKKEKDLLNDYLGAQTWLEFMADKLEEDNSLLKDCLRALEAGFLKGGGGSSHGKLNVDGIQKFLLDPENASLVTALVNVCRAFYLVTVATPTIKNVWPTSNLVCSTCRVKLVDTVFVNGYWRAGICRQCLPQDDKLSVPIKFAGERYFAGRVKVTAHHRLNGHKRKICYEST